MKDFWEVVNRVINQSDLVIQVLDARFPEESRNREIEAKIRKKGKKLIYVLNKSDLVKESFENIKLDFEPYVFVSATKNLGTTILRKMIFKGVEKRPMNVGVVGYPNTGKSSIINVLKQRKSAKTSPSPGFTRGVQKIKISKGVYLLDTPGVIPFMEKNELKHTLINVKDAAKVEDPDVIAMKIISEVLFKDKKILENAYNIKIDTWNPQEILDQIAKKFNWLLKGGLPNIDLTSRRIITDLQRGKIEI